VRYNAGMSALAPGNKNNTKQIKEKLLKHRYSGSWSPSLDLIDDIIQQFWFRDFMNSFISEELFLKLLQKYLDKNKPAHFNRFKFYEFLFRQLFGQRQLEALKSVGAVFELMQTDTMSLADLKKLLNEPKLKNLNIQKLFKSGLLLKTKNRSAKWAHHTLTEYLATAYILSSKDQKELAAKLIIFKHEEIEAIKPSWYGTIRFLLESEQKEIFTKWLIGFATDHPPVIDEHYSEILTSIAFTQHENPLSSALQRQLFFQIYDAYKKQLIWLSVWTRSYMGKLIKKSYIPTLKKDLTGSRDPTRRYVLRGNAIAIIDAAIKSQKRLFSKLELEFWKKQFINLANKPDDPNNYGVLQRHCLHALENFNQPEIIDKVAKYKTNSDSLIREAFVELCGKIAPNYPKAISYVVDAIESGSDIHGRYALYRITSKEGIKHLFSLFNSDDGFLYSFLDKGNIFNYKAKEEKPDDALLDHIRAVLDDDLIGQLKIFILKSFGLEQVHEINKTYFLKRIIQIVVDKDPDFYKEVLDIIAKEESGKARWNKIFDLGHLFPLLLTMGNLISFAEQLSKLHERGPQEVEDAIYRAKYLRGKKGEAIYILALKKQIIKPPGQPVEQIDYEAQRKANAYKEFVTQLEPAPDQYMPLVFGLYSQSEFLQKKATHKQKRRLAKLAIESNLDKINPRKFNVSFSDKKSKSGQYTITSLASYFGSLVRIGLMLFPRRLKCDYRQKIIDFIPYAYSDDQQAILDALPKIKDEELEWVNSVFFDTSNDRRYLIPSGYLHLVSEYLDRECKFPSVIKVIGDLANDKLLSVNDRSHALEVLQKLSKPKDDLKPLFQDLFDPSTKDEDLKELSKKANAVLIETYRDPEAMKWRFDQIKNNVITSKKLDDGGVIWLGNAERELVFGGFANPLIALKDLGLLSNFVELLDLSFAQLTNKQTEKYGQYLQKIILDYLTGLKPQDGLKAFSQINSHLARKPRKQANWFTAQLEDIKTDLISKIGAISPTEARLLLLRNAT